MTTDAPSRRRWLWVTLAVVMVGVSALPATYLLVRWQGRRELAAVTAALDADDPNWRMPGLFAARNERLRKLPANSADTAAAAAALLPDGWERTLTDTRWPGDGPPNRQPTADDAGRVRAVLTERAAALRAAQPLRDQPDGGSVLVVPDYSAYMLNLNLGPTQERRRVVAVLTYAAATAALDGNAAEAVGHVRAGLNTARSVGDEPTLISQLVRVACTQTAVRSAERVLGTCQPGDELAGLQAAFEREAGERFMRDGMRGELASADQIMTNLGRGTAAGPAGGGATLNPYWSHDHAAGLRLIRAGIEDAGRPAHARTAAAAVEQELGTAPRYKVPLSRMLAPAVSKVGEADARNQAAVAAAVAALACERHRRATGSWPTTLADLPQSLLATVPADPFDGKPVRYKRTADGAVVYSVGPNRVDDGGTPLAADPKSGDVVFRLFDPAARKLPALPPAPADTP